MRYQQQKRSGLTGLFLAGLLLFSAGIPGQEAEPPAASSLSAADCPYTVRSGDTLARIARHLTGRPDRFPAIMQYNALQTDTIYPGDIVMIPNDWLLPEYQCGGPSNKSSSSINREKYAQDDVQGEIEGVVFDDRNNNGVHDTPEEEPGVAEVELVLVREGRRLATDEAGIAVFTDVEAGEHAVGLDASTVPEGYRLCTDPTVLLTLAEGDRAYAAFGVCAAPPENDSD